MTTAHLEEHPWYEGVFLALVVLASLKVVVSLVFDLPPAGKFLVLSAMGFSKALLVAVYFMHLKFESWKLISFVLTPVLCTILLIGYLMVEARFDPAAVIFSVVGVILVIGLIIAYFVWSRVVSRL